MAFSAIRGAVGDWRHFLLILVLGQITSLCLTSTSVLSEKLAANENVSLPNFQSFLVYVLLFIVYMPITLARLGIRKVFLNIKKRFYWYIFLAAVDVEGNYFVIKAYEYTSLLACMLLDTWTLPCVVVLSYFLLKARYWWLQILGVLMCLGGMGLLIKGDVDAGKNYEAVNAVKGDIFMLIGATCYALSNTTEEFIVRHRPQYETVAWLGFFGTIINGVQMGIIEHKKISQLVWTKEVVGYTLGFDLVMFVLYTIVPFLFRLSSATFYNLSILTSDFYGLIFAKYMFHQKITAIYAGAFVLIVAGLIVYYVKPHPPPEHMARVPGFRTYVPGDIIQPGAPEQEEEDGAKDCSGASSASQSQMDEALSEYGSIKVATTDHHADEEQAKNQVGASTSAY
ncbi:hypothetical protein IW140_004219 [Coemansia sp. RSA 1813]|nr:hypothetical protein EV178_004320 [Coemansia sp. RSA 1646]KAJ1769478.1 hypothetical protein LPJ74_004026 [Coemansia sp. RSA 1843]KAJ2088071.1 hypothetical protein IW138_004491 [Coemansia sp. RSA 986]KAJ2214858.1 hypothetical protein EV179_002668 [Coemansia sp. RSA 487]KAJ2568048.1 hypothetical protein IW140_004219 [Coemansia sp. RSA 1813]